MKHTRKAKVSRLKSAVERGLVKPQDAELVEEFLQDYATMQALSKGSTDKYYYSSQAILEMLKEIGAELRTMDDKEVLEIIRRIQNSEWSEATREDYWKRWKKIFKWLHEEKGIGTAQAHKRTEEYVYRRNKNREEKKEILTEEEVLRVVHAEPYLCYKVTWAIVYEAGLRIGEALSLRLRDVTRTQNNKGYVIKLPKSKTDKRTISLYGWSTDYLNRWLKQHPRKDDRNALLLLNTKRGALEYRIAAKRLKIAVKLAGIDKHISPHCLRHSRASHLANSLNEQKMCKFFGWSIGSDMPRTYIRENAIDLDKALREVYGIIDPEDKQELGVSCHWCGHKNPKEAEHCDGCNKTMDVSEEVRQIDAISDMERLVMRMVEEKYAEKMDSIIKNAG